MFELNLNLPVFVLVVHVPGTNRDYPFFSKKNNGFKATDHIILLC